VAPLVRLLVGVSRAVNSSLGLTGVPIPPGEEPPETVTQVQFACDLGGMQKRCAAQAVWKRAQHTAHTSVSWRVLAHCP
jgi:hypothetical protein